jgi:hypothetical protein
MNQWHPELQHVQSCLRYSRHKSWRAKVYGFPCPRLWLAFDVSGFDFQCNDGWDLRLRSSFHNFIHRMMQHLCRLFSDASCFVPLFDQLTRHAKWTAPFFFIWFVIGPNHYLSQGSRRDGSLGSGRMSQSTGFGRFLRSSQSRSFTISNCPHSGANIFR